MKITCRDNSSVSTNCQIVNDICNEFGIEYSTFSNNSGDVEYFIEEEYDDDIEFTIINNMILEDICIIVENLCDFYGIDFSFDANDKTYVEYTLSKDMDCSDCDDDCDNDIDIELSDDEFLAIAKMAHERDCTFNEMINEIIEDYIFEVECDK